MTYQNVTIDSMLTPRSRYGGVPMGLLVLVLCLLGCGRSSSDLSEAWTVAISRYLSSDIEDAEAAMLGLLETAAELGSAPGAEFMIDRVYASTYSRLYLLQKQLGKDDTAAAHYEAAARYWQKEYVSRGRPIPSPEEIRNQIEAVDQHLGTPAWSSRR